MRARRSRLLAYAARPGCGEDIQNKNALAATTARSSRRTRSSFIEEGMTVVQVAKVLNVGDFESREPDFSILGAKTNSFDELTTIGLGGRYFSAAQQKKNPALVFCFPASRCDGPRNFNATPSTVHTYLIAGFGVRSNHNDFNDAPGIASTILIGINNRNVQFGSSVDRRIESNIRYFDRQVPADIRWTQRTVWGAPSQKQKPDQPIHQKTLVMT